MNIKKILVLGSALFFINQFGQYPYFSIYNLLKTNFKSDISYSDFKNIPKEYDALDFLNLSTEKVQGIDEGGCFCGDYAKKVFEIYMNLIKINNRMNLEDKIRLASGSVTKNGEISGHVWIEIKGSLWKEYNSQEPIKRGYPKESNFNWSNLGEIEYKCAVTLPGKKISLPHDLDSNSLNPFKRGCLRFLYDIRVDIKQGIIVYSKKIYKK